MFKLPCMVSFESLHGSYWPFSNKRFTVTVGCTWCVPLSRPNRAMQRLKTNHAWQFKHEVWVRKIKTKNIAKYQRFTRLNGRKREKFGKMKSTGEPDAVKWFWKKVSLVWRTIFHFAIYVVFEKLAVSSVIDNNRERDVRRYMMLINSLYQSAEARIVQVHTIFLARER